MPKPAKYLTRGTLKQCLNFMFTHWTNYQDQYLSIISHGPGRYYAVVNDTFLNSDLNVPEVHGSRVMVRCTLKELTTLCKYYHHIQSEMRF